MKQIDHIILKNLLVFWQYGNKKRVSFDHYYEP